MFWEGDWRIKSGRCVGTSGWRKMFTIVVCFFKVSWFFLFSIIPSVMIGDHGNIVGDNKEYVWK